MGAAAHTSTPHHHYRFAVRLQAALSVDEVERAYLGNVRDVVFARGHGFYRLHPETGAALAIAADVGTDFLEEYEQFGRDDDPVLRLAKERVRPIDSSRATKRTAWEASGAYQCLNRAGFYHSMEAPVLIAGQQCATLNFARWPDDPPFNATDLRGAQRLSEQMGLALERAIRYEETGQRATLLQDALDHLPQAVVVTDLDANVIFRNRAAAGGTAQADDALVPSVHEAIEEAMGTFRRDNARVNVVSVDSGDGSGRRMVVKSIRLRERNTASLSLIYPSQGDEQGRLPVWDVLSPREQEIAELVSQGLTTKEIAGRAFITENTVKQHLKRIFAKTDARNRAELMQRIWAARRPEPPGPRD